ncbi:MAG: class I SAM-dependent methyltransferase [Chloroflexi bacterium]|nr:class I SAM-dependent methyltransferase [Chloroflexota bacterium]
MFERVVESYHNDAFEGVESAANYAESTAHTSMVRFRGFLQDLETLDIGGRYLEVGPGPGLLAITIAQEYPDVRITGVELSPDMASVGQGYVERAGLANKIQFVVGNAENGHALESLGRFDLAYSTFSLHHWKDPKRVIQNLMSALVDGGTLYIYDLRRAWWLYWVPVNTGFWDSIRAAYVAPEIHEMLQEIGIERYEVKNVFPFMQAIVIKK